jgi:hypothetical protein
VPRSLSGNELAFSVATEITLTGLGNSALEARNLALTRQQCHAEPGVLEHLADQLADLHLQLAVCRTSDRHCVRGLKVALVGVVL